jgi:hypothetical protein
VSGGKLVRAMSEIVAGLIGVVAGGLVTGAVQVIQNRQDRRLKRKVAARLISSDLSRANIALNEIVDTDHWPDALSFEDMRARWRAQQEPFAAAVNAYDWYRVDSVYEHLAKVAARCRPGEALNDGERAVLEVNLKQLNGAYEAAIARATSARERHYLSRRAQQESF